MDRQFNSARAVSADFHRCNVFLPRLRLLAHSARAPRGLCRRCGLLPAIAKQSRNRRARCRDASCRGGSCFRLPRSPHPHLTTGDNNMVKLLLGVASTLFLFNTASFAAEKTVTLAVENMTCTACPHIVKGS